MKNRRLLLLALPFLLALAGCDQLQQKLLGEDPAAKAARQEAEGKAVGGGCRHSGRAIEDCYSIYYWLPKAAIFAGWQDMDGYMRTNNIETVEPQLPPPPAPGTKPHGDGGDKGMDKGSDKSTDKGTGTDKGSDKSAGKNGDKADDKGKSDKH